MSLNILATAYAQQATATTQQATAQAAAGNAANAAVPHGSPLLSSVWMFVVIGAFLYFLMWRPQSRRAKAQQTMLAQLQVGDEVMTSGGLIGKIREIDENFLQLAVSETIVIQMQRSSVSTLLPKGTLKFR